MVSSVLCVLDCRCEPNGGNRITEHHMRFRGVENKLSVIVHTGPLIKSDTGRYMKRILVLVAILFSIDHPAEIILWFTPTSHKE